ncbi:MAG: hypothetical protein JXP34_26325 [Planctomycetes bacterium]|nr:hypothetical protein [Planctomycetota bacterium]
MRVRERARPALRSALAELGLASISDIARDDCGRTLKQDARSRVALVGPLRDGMNLVVKRYRPLPHLRWRTLCRSSAARREHAALHRIRRAGVPAVEPLGWYECRRGGLVSASVIVTRHIPSEDLRHAVARGDGLSPRGEPLAGIAASLAAAVRKLHDAGIFAWTLFDKNILLPVDPADPHPFYLCDTPSLRVRRDRGWGSARRHDIACMLKWWCKALAPADVATLLLSACGDRMIDRAGLREAERILARLDRMENRTLIARLSTWLSRSARRLAGGSKTRISTNPKYLRQAGTEPKRRG